MCLDLSLFRVYVCLCASLFLSVCLTLFHEKQKRKIMNGDVKQRAQMDGKKQNICSDAKGIVLPTLVSILEAVPAEQHRRWTNSRPEGE